MIRQLELDQLNLSTCKAAGQYRPILRHPQALQRLRVHAKVIGGAT